MRELSLTPVKGRYPKLSDYRLIAKLGGGGMADAYLSVVSRDGGFNKLYVLKVLHPPAEQQSSVDWVGMFQEEGNLAARLNHPHIVHSTEIGCDAGQHFIAMEYLEGQPLSRLQQEWTFRPESFPLVMRLFVLTQVLDALDYAHSLADYDGTPLHIVHRDVSPQNVFVTYTGHAKLLDFGIAKTRTSPRTRAGVVKGKIPYMAPEQVRGAPVDARADIFGVGVILWECVAGRSLQGNESDYEILKRLAEGNLPRLRDVVSGVPPELESMVSRALALDPEQRYPDARSFREDLLAIPGVRDVTPVNVGQAVRTAFVSERLEILSMIREALRPDAQQERGEPPSGPIALPVRPREPKGFRDEDSTTSPTTTAVASGGSDPPTPPQSAPEKPVGSAPSPRFGWQAAAVAGVALAVVLAFAVRPLPQAQLSASLPARDVEPGPRGAAPAAPPSKAAESAAPAEPGEVASVRLRVSVEPSTAVLTLDGAPLPQNPFDGHRPRDRAVHALRMTAPGYGERSLPLTFDRDIELSVVLARLDARPAKTGSQPKLGLASQKVVGPTPADDYMRDLPPPNRPTQKSSNDGSR